MYVRFLPIALIITATIELPTALAHSTSTTVVMTAEGFSPRQVTLDVSSTIIFLNEDTVAHWPASNGHPRHDIYPEFDPTQEIAPGDFWAFKPSKPGTWHYHDHLNPHRQGTIIVTSEEDTSSPTTLPSPEVIKKPGFFSTIKHAFIVRWQVLTSIAKQLRKSPEPSPLPPAAFFQLPEKAQYDELERMVNVTGSPLAWQYVKDVFSSTSNSSVNSKAHDAAHFIGSLIYEKEGLPGLSICDTTFAFGCYHGFTEGAFTNNLDLLVPVANACEKVGPVLSGPWSSCIHGIGHGIASYHNATDLFPALTTCDTLNEGDTFCHDGVFMEFSNSAPNSFYNRTNPLHPCDSVPEKYQLACGRNIIAAASKRFNLPPLEIAKKCLQAKKTFTSSCIDTFGFLAATADKQDGARITSRCQELEGQPAITQCAGAAAGELVFQNYTDWQTQAPRVCEGLPAREQTSCFMRLNQTITNYQP